MAKILDQIEKRQNEHQNVLDLHDLILNGKPLQEIPGLVQKTKNMQTTVDSHAEYITLQKTKDIVTKVEEHDDYVKRNKLIERLIIMASSGIGATIAAILIKFIENKLLR